MKICCITLSIHLILLLCFYLKDNFAEAWPWTFVVHEQRAEFRIVLRRVGGVGGGGVAVRWVEVAV